MKVNIYDVWNCDLSGHGDGDKSMMVSVGSEELISSRVIINSFLKFCRHYWRPGIGTTTGSKLTGTHSSTASGCGPTVLMFDDQERHPLNPQSRNFWPCLGIGSYVVIMTHERVPCKPGKVSSAAI